MPSLQHLETQKMDFKNLTEKDVELLDYQDCRPGTPGRDPLDSKILPDHVTEDTGAQGGIRTAAGALRRLIESPRLG